MMFSDADIGRRVRYTDRNAKTHDGTIREVIPLGKSVEVQLDGLDERRKSYCPFDTVRFID